VTIDEYDNEEDGINIKLDSKPLVRDTNSNAVKNAPKGNNLIDDITSIFGSVTVNPNPVPVTNTMNDIFGQFNNNNNEPKNNLFMNFGNVILINNR
jgi:hypothetical protein